MLNGNIYRTISILIAGAFSISSCKKYLDEKPDRSMVVPRKVEELQGLLDYANNYQGFPNAGQLGSDDYYLTDANWASSSQQDRDNYIWLPATDRTTDYTGSYQSIARFNTVLSVIDGLDDASATQATKDQVKGAALFYRAFRFYELAQVFAPAYSSGNAATGYGIPLKISADVEDLTVRSTVQSTYDKIIEDTKAAIPLLPSSVAATLKTRPSKAAAYALLARTYLLTANYDSSLKYADMALQLQNTLIDYNPPTINSAASVPFAVMNNEVILHAVSTFSFTAYNSRVDSTLYDSYDNNDLRKAAFFGANADGSHFFKGNYSGDLSYWPFAGIATDELYLLRAESHARKGNTAPALADLNTLLQKRWKAAAFTPVSAPTSAEALNLVLKERRKELLYRGSLRWTDLRRLNQENGRTTTIKRYLNGKSYELSPNDLRYTFLIPESVISISGIKQNPR